MKKIIIIISFAVLFIAAIYWFPDSQKSIEELWEIETGVTINNNETSNETDMDSLRQKYPSISVLIHSKV
jgi:hypothetical protein